MTTHAFERQTENLSRHAAPLRTIEAIYSPPPPHWVGDGFRVAGYFNAIPDALRRMSPFVLFDYHAPYAYEPTTSRRGVGSHPHRGFETVSLAWEGSVAHRDSSGAEGSIGPGDVQWMTAGAGVVHEEFHGEEFARTGGTFHMAQLWVNLPKAHKMATPRYQALTAGEMGVAKLENDAGEVRVIAGEYQGAKGPAKTFTKINVFDVRLRPGGKANFSFPANENLGLLVMKGAIAVNGQTAKTNAFVLFDNVGEEVVLEAEGDAHVLILSGEPIDEPIVQYGPFVMNTRQEIIEAINDFNAGKFGRI